MRVTGVGAMPKIRKLQAPEGGSLAAARPATGQCVFRVDGELKTFETAFYRRTLLPVGETIRTARRSCCRRTAPRSFRRGWSAINDAAGNLILTIDGDA